MEAQLQYTALGRALSLSARIDELLAVVTPREVPFQVGQRDYRYRLWLRFLEKGRLRAPSACYATCGERLSFGVTEVRYGMRKKGMGALPAGQLMTLHSYFTSWQGYLSAGRTCICACPTGWPRGHILPLPCSRPFRRAALRRTCGRWWQPA